MSVRLDVQRMLFNISALVDLGQEVTSTKHYTDRMKTALYVITGMFSVPHAALFVYDVDRKDLAYLTGKGVAYLAHARLSFDGSDLARLPRNEPVSTRSLQDSGLIKRNAEAFSRMRANVLVPLYAKHEFIGVIVLGPRLSGDRYLQMERSVLQVAAHQIATAIHNARLFVLHSEQAAENRRLYENMRQIYHDTIQAFATAIDAKDQYTKHHSYRVANYAAAIARELRWSDTDVEAIYVAGLLHDIGKLSLDIELINKEAALTDQEKEKIKRHAEVSYDIVAKIRLPWQDVPRYIRHHHERPDGRGYPDALPARELSDGAKILALADSYDAMTSDRPYRIRLSSDEAMQEIRRCEGTQFDAAISSVMFGLIERSQTTKQAQPTLMLHHSGDMHLPAAFEVPWRTHA
jgi:putative nucleotidyltransferase with HDIG domain